MSEKISVVVPTYNRAGLLIKTIESVLRQTHAEFELIVVDDGSTDDTSAKIARFSHSDKFVYHRKSNEGRSIARNTGAQLASGDWLLFLDSDDLLIETALELFARAAAANPAFDVISGNAAFVDADMNVVTEAEANGFYQNLELNGRELIEPYRQLIRNVFFVTGSFAVRKTAFERSGGFDPQLDVCEDLDWLLRTVLECRVYCASDQVISIRDHNEGKTAPIQIRRAAIVVGHKHLKHFVPSLSGHFKNKVTAEWLNRIGDEHYNLEENYEAFQSYVRAAYYDPANLSESHFRRQLLASLFPVSLKNRVRKFRRTQTDSV